MAVSMGVWPLWPGQLEFQSCARYSPSWRLTGSLIFNHLICTAGSSPLLSPHWLMEDISKINFNFNFNNINTRFLRESSFLFKVDSLNLRVENLVIFCDIWKQFLCYKITFKRSAKPVVIYNRLSWQHRKFWKICILSPSLRSMRTIKGICSLHWNDNELGAAGLCILCGSSANLESYYDK